MQKTCVIIGSTAFIVWLVLAIENTSFNYVDSRDFGYNITSFISSSIYNLWGYQYDDSATWMNSTTFITWVVSIIAFKVYKD